MLGLNTLKKYIIDYIDSNKSSVIYFGVGSYYNYYGPNNNSKTKINHWRPDENQQLPPFLHDFKLKNLDVPILIILIDPSFNDEPPYVVKSNDFLEKSWTTSQEFHNLYLSNIKLNVIKISDYVIWDKKYLNSSNFNFEQFLMEICEHVSNPINNTLLFYHEFCGTNVILLENLIKKKLIHFNPNKICIDITRGADSSCYFNLSNPEFYPIIELNEANKLKYLNPQTLESNKINNIIFEYKKYTIGFHANTPNCIFSKNNLNLLFHVPNEIILCFQIIKLDKIIFDYISSGIIPLIRYLYVCENNQKINLDMTGIYHLHLLQAYIKNYDEKYIVSCIDTIDDILENIRLISDINNNKFDNLDNDENTDFLKKNIIYNLFDIMKKILTNIVMKYKINEGEINEFINNLEGLYDKYHMIDYYNNFISRIYI